MTAPARILVVDDTPANVKLLVDVLTAKGYQLSAAANGEEALARIAEQAPDLVLLDIMMPGLSGYDVCRRIRADPKPPRCCRWCCAPRSTRSRSASTASRPAPTTSSPSRSTSRNCSRG